MTLDALLDFERSPVLNIVKQGLNRVVPALAIMSALATPANALLTYEDLDRPRAYGVCEYQEYKLTMSCEGIPGVSDACRVIKAADLAGNPTQFPEHLGRFMVRWSSDGEIIDCYDLPQKYDPNFLCC